MVNKKPTTTPPTKNTTGTKTATATKIETASKPAATVTAARTVVTGRTVTHEQIARRAYEIFKSGTGGSTEDNWFRAERELRARA